MNIDPAFRAWLENHHYNPEREHPRVLNFLRAAYEAEKKVKPIGFQTPAANQIESEAKT